jgi:signal transduction histidine kinase
MRISKTAAVSVLILLLLFGWAWSIYSLYLSQASLSLVLAVIVPSLLAAAIIYSLHNILPSQRIREIAELARRIEDHIDGTMEPIDPKLVHKEIRPLVQSINTLLGYFEDRYNQERDFTANASHELRTPLAGIRLQTEIALKTEVPEKREKALRNVIKAVDRGTRLVEQLLTLSRLTADKVDLAIEAVSPGRVATKTVAELADIAEARSISLVMKNWDDRYIEASEDSIAILINNLIRNALVYCPSNSEVSVDVESTSDKVSLVVADNGPGIPYELREAVLERFRKAERGTKVGTGLGLAIVKRIADLHSANVALEDGPNGRGLLVRVTFRRYGV